MSFAKLEPPEVCFIDCLILAMFIKQTPAIGIQFKGKCRLFAVNEGTFFVLFYELIQPLIPFRFFFFFGKFF